MMTRMTPLNEVEAKILQINAEAAKRGALSFWTVYDHPRDYPDSFVARRHEVIGGESKPTPDALVASTLETLQNTFARLGLTKFQRYPSDDPKIVETWMA